MPHAHDPYTEESFTLVGGQTKSPGQEVGHPTETGLYVPALTVATTIVIQVSHEDVDGSYKALKSGTGSDVLSFASGSGDFYISANDFGAILPFQFFRVVLGASQGASPANDKVFRFFRKVSRVGS